MKVLRRSTALILTVMMLITIIPHTFAVDTPVERIEPLRSGYREGYVTVYGTTYSYTASLAASKTDGVRSVFSCNAWVRREHMNLSVVFLTDSYGSVSQSGGHTDVTKTGTSYSAYVVYQYGMEHVIGYSSISTTIYVYGTNTYDIALSV